jgi:hypothetical protein
MSKKPAPPFNELQEFIMHLEGELEARLELCDLAQTTGTDAVAMVLNAVAAARKEMGW